MTIFEEVKSLVDMPTAARHYGIEVNRSNMALCPFHHERTPSMKLYADHYHCFGCQAHGDVITLVQELFGLSAMDAVRQINSDFSLCLDVDKPPDIEAVNRRRTIIARQKAEKMKSEQMYDVLLRYYTLLDKYKIRYAPKNSDEEMDERFVYALQNIGYAEYLFEMFHCASKEQQKELKQEVDRIEREYKKCTDKWGEW